MARSRRSGREPLCGAAQTTSEDERAPIEHTQRLREALERQGRHPEWMVEAKARSSRTGASNSRR